MPLLKVMLYSQANRPTDRQTKHLVSLRPASQQHCSLPASDEYMQRKLLMHLAFEHMDAETLGWVQYIAIGCWCCCYICHSSMEAQRKASLTSGWSHMKGM